MANQYTVTSDMISKFIKVVVTDADGKEYSATTADAVAAKDSTLTASQTGSNTIVAVAGSELMATDAVVLKKGSTEQTITYALGEDNKTVTITTSTKIAADDYTVEITPTDTALAPMTATLKGEAEKLDGLNFGKELALISNTNFYSVQTTITGANQWGEDFNLASGDVAVYPSVAIATAAETATNAWDGVTETNYDPKSKVYTLIKGGTIPFQIGDKVNFTAIYTSGSTVIQSTAELAVANVPYVASMEFGELTTTNAKLVGERVIISNFNKGTYYLPVIAKDQYDNVLDADTLNDKVVSSSLFINPTAAQGAYGGFVEFEKLDDGTTAMKVTGNATSLPGTATITIAGLGGFSTSTSFTVEDNPYIAKLDVVFPGSLYQGTTAEFTIEATDQYGDPVSLYDQKNLAKYTDGSGIYLGDWNTLVKSGSSIATGSGSMTFERNSADKALVFKYTPALNAVNDVITITTAVPQVETKTLTIGKVGKAASIQKTLDDSVADSSLTITSGGTVDFANALVFVDTNGEVITGTNANIQKPYFVGDEITDTKGSALNTVAKDAAKINENTEIRAESTGYYYTITTGTAPTYVADATITHINETTTYTVSLYEVVAKDAAGDGVASKKLLDSKDFKVVVTDPNPSGNQYDEYSVEVKEADKLLYNVAKADPKVLDSAEIIVKGTDANNNTATLTYGVHYTLTVDSNLEVDPKDPLIKPEAGSSPLPDGKDATEGEATVLVWDKVSGEKVGSVKLAYSNANPVATEWSITKDKADSNNDGDVEQEGTDWSDFTGDTIDLPNGSGYAYGTGALKLAANADGASYLVECKNQYGTRFLGTGFVAGGEKLDMGTGATGVSLTHIGLTVKKYSFQATAPGIDAFDFYAVVDSDSMVAAQEELDKFKNTVMSASPVGTNTIADALLDCTNTSLTTTTSKANVAVNITDGTIIAKNDDVSYVTATTTINDASVTWAFKVTQGLGSETQFNATIADDN